jgi:hypothetical protein
MTAKITLRLAFLSFISLLLFSCQNTTHNDNPPPVDPPKQIISAEQAKEMYDTYTDRRVSIISEFEDSISADGTIFTPTRYAEYDLETIKNYIAYIEQESKKASVDIKTLRFYLSSYPNSNKFQNGGAVKYPRRNTFFVLPTMDYEGKNVGFSVEETDGKYTAVPINRRTTKPEGNQDTRQADSTGQMNEAGFFMMNNAATMEVNSSLILNESTLSPPPAGANDFGIN